MQTRKEDEKIIFQFSSGLQTHKANYLIIVPSLASFMMR